MSATSTNKRKCLIFQVWPEVTDPEKFVFEDVAIATYLLVGWTTDCFLCRLSLLSDYISPEYLVFTWDE